MVINFSYAWENILGRKKFQNTGRLLYVALGEDGETAKDKACHLS